MKDREYIENLIARFLNGNCTEAELHELKTWTETSPENKKEYLSIKDIWDASKSPKENKNNFPFFTKINLRRLKNPGCCGSGIHQLLLPYF